ncbi:MAG: methyl-accepting chemotaxis protein [Stellaceae bacterium]
MRALDNTNVAKKLLIAYVLFLLPVTFLLYVIVDKSLEDIGFAQKEILGTRYIAALHEVQDALVRNETALPNPALADKVAAAEKGFGAAMETAGPADAAVKALRANDPDRKEPRAAVRDLMSKIADGSNLTLDPDLDSFYVMDAVTGKIPDLIDRLYDLARLTASYTRKAELSAEEQTVFLVQNGNVGPVVDGMGSSFGSAFKANATTQAALAASLKSAQSAVAAGLDGVQTAALRDRASAREMPASVVPALSALSSLDQAGFTELIRLLDARVSRFERSFIVDLSIALVLFAAGGVFSFVAVQRGAVRPLIQVTDRMRALADGNKEIEIPGVGRKDEIGQIAAAVQVFKDGMIKADRLAAEQQAEQARKEKRQQAIEALIRDFERSVAGAFGTLSSASTQLDRTARSMGGTAEKTSHQAATVAAASEQATANVQTVASATEELSSSISEISRQVAESTRIASEAKGQATDTNAQIEGLAEAAQKIGDVVKLISDIAGQTNLLALNATIEAARAGDAGKGFAVVASEVKSLANQTAKATEEISAKIAEMQAATGQSVAAVQTIGQTIERIDDIATTIASAVEEQGAATKEIARNVQQAAAGTNEVSSNIAAVTQAAGETGNGAAQVLSASSDLAKQSEILRAQVDDFLAKIRAA